MLNRLVWLMLLCASANAFAAEWVSLPAIPNGDQYFYDKSKLVIKDDDVTFWKKVQFKSPQSLKGTDVVSGVLRERINCADHTAKLLTYLYYSATGE
ncbi:MAG TPA: surface-adhesin E family protein, partial [Methylobacter sp.]